MLLYMWKAHKSWLTDDVYPKPPISGPRDIQAATSQQIVDMVNDAIQSLDITQYPKLLCEVDEIPFHIHAWSLPQWTEDLKYPARYSYTPSTESKLYTANEKLYRHIGQLHHTDKEDIYLIVSHKQSYYVLTIEQREYFCTQNHLTLLSSQWKN